MATVSLQKNFGHKLVVNQFKGIPQNKSLGSIVFEQKCIPLSFRLLLVTRKPNNLVFFVLLEKKSDFCRLR